MKLAHVMMRSNVYTSIVGAGDTVWYYRTLNLKNMKIFSNYILID